MYLRKNQTQKEELKRTEKSHKKWKITFHWPKPIKMRTPKEFTCPISLSLMADPVIVSSGQTLDRNCALICKRLRFYPVLENGSVLDLSNIIPNLSLKTAIANWCKTNLVEAPKPVCFVSAEKLVKRLMIESNRLSQLSSSSVESVTAALPPPTPLPLATRPACLSTSSSEDIETLNRNSSESEDILSRMRNGKVLSTRKMNSGEFDDSIISRMVNEKVLNTRNVNSSEFDQKVLNTRNMSSSGFGDSIVSRMENEKALNTRNTNSYDFDDNVTSRMGNGRVLNTGNTNSGEFDDIISRIRSNTVSEQEEILKSLRKITRTREETRERLCTPGLLSALKSSIQSGYLTVQVNAVAILVNLSLKDHNKVKIVRSGIIPPLINVLKGGFIEARDHAAGVIFSLALDDRNKTAIGVLGALPPLMHCLRAESCRARHDSALALCHLSLVQSNRTKLVRLGAVGVLLGMVKTGHMTNRVMLVLCNLALGADGREAMLDGGAVECFVCELENESTRESCLVALYRLSYGGLRFKLLAKKARVEEALVKAEKRVSEKGREKVKRVLEVLRGKDEEEEEELDWEELLKTDDNSRTF